MNKAGAIVIIEDDKDDQEIFSEVLKELGYPNQVLFFNDGDAALDFLTKSNEKAFLILSDINLPKLTGLELRDKIHNNAQLRLKCIPYLFFTTSVQEAHVIEAYSKSVQGFFTKPDSFSEVARILKNIIEYWKDCKSPVIS
jgi:CheY-like chemotaxis protein